MKWIRIIKKVSVLLGSSIVKKSEIINTSPITEIKSLNYSEVENQFDLAINYNSLGMIYQPHTNVQEYVAEFTLETSIPQKFTTNNRLKEDFNSKIFSKLFNW